MHGKQISLQKPQIMVNLLIFLHSQQKVPKLCKTDAHSFLPLRDLAVSARARKREECLAQGAQRAQRKKFFSLAGRIYKAGMLGLKRRWESRKVGRWEGGKVKDDAGIKT
jgi:hypothetical protein